MRLDWKNIKVKLVLGILIGLICLYLAFRKVDVDQMWQAFRAADYFYVLPAIAVLFLSHFLRAFRWRYLLAPIERIDTGSLFSSLIIGYTGNLIMPAHLGEVLRAYVLGKKKGISVSTTLATILVERVLDVFSLLALMLLAILLYPFPAWLIKSGYMVFAGSVGLLTFLILLKKKTSSITHIIGLVLKPLPMGFDRRAQTSLERFLSGIVPLNRWHDYITVGILSLLIWSCYGLIFHLSLQAFNFADTFALKWSACLILLVVTSIAVVVPSAPGYVGTYHYLCQISLALFGVSAAPALAFATVVHGINFLPILVTGLFLARYEGMAILKMSQRVSEDVAEVAP